MTLCKFFQSGTCRNGASCRFEHTTANANPFQSNTNRFNALNTGGSNSNSYKPQDNPYKITVDNIKSDLTDERPRWILSSYAPGKDAPDQLFGGYPREQSLEEVMMYIRGSGNEQQAMSEVMGIYQQAEQQIQTTLSNLEGAMQFVLEAENKHPNRIDVCKQTTPQGGTTGVFARDVAGPRTGFSNPLTSTSNPFSAAPQQTQNPFGGGSNSSSGTPAFGQPSAMGQKPNPFAATPSSSTFGQPSTLGPAKSAFGQPSQVGANAPAFGQTSQVGANAPAFGQTSALGQKPNPFGNNTASLGPGGWQQNNASAPSTFGQPSALGQRPNPFSAPASSGPSPFAQAAANSTPSAPNPFGQPAAAASNPFGQATTAPTSQAMDTSTPTQPAANNPFGQPSTQPPFAAVPTANNVFGRAAPQQPSGFGALPAAANPFTQAPANTHPQQGPGQTQTQSAPKPIQNPYGSNSTKQHPDPSGYISKTANGQITSFNGQQVAYKWKVGDKYQDGMPSDGAKGVPAPGVRNNDGTWRKVFFPDGPPGYNKDTEPDAALYSASVKAAYEAMTSAGRFTGDMPEVPPLREECVWNF